MTITQGFDTVVQIKTSCLNQVCRLMHQREVVSHAHRCVQDGQLVQMQFGVPNVAFDSVVHPDGLVRMLVTVHFLAHARPLNDPLAVGENATGTVLIRARLEVPTGLVPLASQDTATVSLSETTIGDVSVVAASAATQNTICNAVLAVLVIGAVPVPVGYLVDAGVSRLALDRSGGAGNDALCICLNLLGTAGTPTGIPLFILQEWAAALSSAFILDRITQELSRKIGTLPALIDDRMVCMVSTPAGCLLQDRQRTYLDSFSVVLVPGAIRLGGQIRQETGSAIVTTIAASWSVDIGLSVNNAGQIDAAAGTPSVQLSGGFASVADWITGGQVAATVSKATSEIFTMGFGAADLGRMLTLIVNQVSSLGRTVNAGVTAQASSVEIRQDALIVHGILNYSGGASLPVAEPMALATTVPGQLVLHAGSSWAPGDDLVAVAWTFGDGHSALSSGSNTALAVAHTYTPGIYQACLTVTDGHGRSVSRCISVSPGILAVRLVNDRGLVAFAWEFCKPSSGDVELDIEVACSGTRMPGVTLTARGLNWQKTTVTDAAGLGRLVLPVADIQYNSATGGQRPGFALGGIDIEASLSGFQTATRRLWMIDCESLAIALDMAKKLRDRILDRLAGYAEFEKIREMIIKEQFLIPMLDGPAPPLPPVPFVVARLSNLDPRARDTAAIAFSVETLLRLTVLLEQNPASLPLKEVFGIRGDGPELAAGIEKRLAVLWNQIEREVKTYQESYGPPFPR